MNGLIRFDDLNKILKAVLALPFSLPISLAFNVSGRPVRARLIG